MKGETIGAETAEQWLRDIGCEPSEVPQAGARWALKFNYPPTHDDHPMLLLSPTAAPKAVMIGSRITVSPEHVAAFGELDDEAKVDFLRELRHTMFTDFAEFQIDPPGPGLVCPKEFQISVTRFADGLSLDELFTSISRVFKTELLAIECFQTHLTPRDSGGSSGFEFYKVGGGIN